jgi:hypothetical protein
MSAMPSFCCRLSTYPCKYQLQGGSVLCLDDKDVLLLTALSLFWYRVMSVQYILIHRCESCITSAVVEMTAVLCTYNTECLVVV